MDGYSVTEAASVLGVPTERVWELLARGVLAGTPDGDTGMRVFLQPRPAPAPPEPRVGNGDAGRQEPERELSPFRELLTEFRNLTERYGQALLALGESRGEVAALRSRVDMLEARIDLRLPGSAAAAGGWSPAPMPFPAEHAVMPTAPAAAPAPAEPGTTNEEVEEEERRAARRRGPRRATESFAEALARAEDPSVPELPRADGASARDHAEADAADTEAVLPRDLLAAEPVPVAEEPAAEPVLVAEEPPVDPVPVAEEPAAEPVLAEEVSAAGFEPAVVNSVAEDAPQEADLRPATAPEEPPVGIGARAVVAAEPVEDETAEQAAVDVTPPPVEPLALETLEMREGEAEATAQVRDIAEPEPIAAKPVEQVAGDDRPELESASVEAELAAEEPTSEAPATEPTTKRAAEPAAESAPDPEPLDWDRERYTTAIEEPDWFEGEAIEVDTEATESAAAEPADAEPVPPEPAAAMMPSEVVHDVVAEETEALVSLEVEADTAVTANEEPPVAEPMPATEKPDEPAWPATDTSGRDEMEVVGGRGRPAAQKAEEQPPALPGSHELDEALAALSAISQPNASASDGTTGAADAPESQPISAEDEFDEWPPRSHHWSSAAQALTPPSYASPRPETTGPASRAYRRLRRIFPG